MSFDDFPDVLNIRDVAQLLRISKNTAYEAARLGQIPSHRIGHRIVVLKSELLKRLGATEERPLHVTVEGGRHGTK